MSPAHRLGSRPPECRHPFGGHSLPTPGGKCAPKGLRGAFFGADLPILYPDLSAACRFSAPKWRPARPARNPEICTPIRIEVHSGYTDAAIGRGSRHVLGCMRVSEAKSCALKLVAGAGAASGGSKFVLHALRVLERLRERVHALAN